MKNSKTKEFFKENFVLIVILLFGFILRLYYLILTKNQAVWWDEGEYLSMGLHWLFNIPYDLNPQRPILIPSNKGNKIGRCELRS